MKIEDKNANVLFPVVGIGASAGGLEQYTAFFKKMPPDSGAAFILVQHLAPDHKSILPEIIQKQTTMRVVTAEDGSEIVPDTVYVLPPNREIILQNSKIILTLPSENLGMRDTIDILFNSIALEAGPLAIGIILSGAGFDGTQGLKSIKENEGIIIVQDPEATEYKSMPQSAIHTGLADFVCRTEEMPGLLGDILPKIRRSPLAGISSNSGGVEHDIRSITNLLFEKTGNDFSKYKKSTILRRITRRMVIKKIETTDDYLNLLEKDPSEVHKLFAELLIGVTSFFRDSDAFSVLEERILKTLVNKQKQDTCLRIWVPGCSTGEEAYTIAIIIKELLRKKTTRSDIQIFATDINEQAIVKARLGLFSSMMKQNLPKNIFSDYFHFRPEIGKFQINSEIRDMIVFAVQNVLVDPPFSQMDLISCRNLLIYLDQEQQDKLFQIFHYALKDDGILFLGESETVGKRNSYFSVIDRKYKIFKKLFSVSRSSPVARMTPVDRFRYRKNDSTSCTQLKNINENYRNIVETFVLEQLSPCTILINSRNEILYIHGRSGLYLEPAAGNMNINITRMAREGLRVPLSNMLRKVKSGKAEQSSRIVEIKNEEDLLYVDILVQSVGADLNAEEKYIVAFSMREKIQKAGNQIIADIDKDKLPLIQELESELDSIREYLQTTIEEKESSNEELQSTNEELQSSNEELQSTNEELETSKEELQSINEELITVNSELENKVEQLTEANNDIDNLLKSTEVATIFLDNELKIKRFTPSVVSIIDLITGDIGRPLNRIVTNLEYTGLNADTEYVHRTLNNIEKEVKTVDGRLFLMHIMPYRTLENINDGVVLTFTDITRLRTIEHKVLQLAKFPDENPFPVMRISREGKLLYANASCDPVLEELNIDDNGLFPLGWINNLKAILDENILTQIEFPAGDKVFIMAVAPIVEEGYVNIYGIDITDRKKAEKELQKRKDQLKLALDSAKAGSWMLDADTLEVTIDENFCRMLGYYEEERKFNLVDGLVHPDDWEAFNITIQDLVKGKTESLSSEHRVKTAEGGWLWIHSWAKKDTEKGRDNTSLYGVVIDISEQKKLEQTLKHSVEEKSMLLRELAHRTKNNMFVVRSMLSLYAANNDNLEFREIARDIDSKIYSMALVHQKLYKSRNFSQIELESFFREFLDILFQSYRNPEKDINLHFEASPVTVHIDRAIPCGIAVAELVSNIFKHAFRDVRRGEIRFSLRITEAGTILLTVSDDGCGVPEGFDFRMQNSLGLKTIFMIVEHQIQGRVEFRNENGLTCEIEFSDIKTDGEL